jgi:hypothetical protein
MAGRRPPPGGLQYGLEHCGEIRDIREILKTDMCASLAVKRDGPGASSVQQC